MLHLRNYLVSHGLVNHASAFFNDSLSFTEHSLIAHELRHVVADFLLDKIDVLIIDFLIRILSWHSITLSFHSEADIRPKVGRRPAKRVLGIKVSCAVPS